MKELDVVKLKENFQATTKSTRGTIVEDYNEKEYEVEFFDGDGDTIDEITVPKNKNFWLGNIGQRNERIKDSVRFYIWSVVERCCLCFIY